MCCTYTSHAVPEIAGANAMFEHCPSVAYMPVEHTSVAMLTSQKACTSDCNCVMQQLRALDQPIWVACTRTKHAHVNARMTM